MGELAKKANVSPSAIRFYESIGIMPIPTRVSGQRRYTIDVLHQLKFIKTAQLAGFSIQEITVLLEGFDSKDTPSERWEQMAFTKCVDLEKQKKHIEEMLEVLNNGLKCKCQTWSECFTKVNSNATCS
ncbi:MAG: MerR family transcriptional regulator [Bacillota bacterium]|uniref:MerR family transcriptional regulator n=1 Tax=Cytobacillus oceanisediminis 2691 TaxID=1196031 RepID=A0A161JV34_9BACI|nr:MULTISPECIES: MerR family transcriptional regulator [Bacillaceae]AND42891.1 MerR family transcriptional regulator [Cytobacillus oceanisediminis 2691]MBN8202687.1 MerR family transcriptional regulator [Bacillus sp. NTK034]USK47618.1 MerR family transcriptional regulator [Cytobacillus oceanisediminis]